MNYAYDAIIVLAVAVCTFLTRLFPFALFGRKQSLHPLVTYIGKILPSAVIAILHIWKRNYLLNIGVGTVCYMILVQIVFR